MDLVVYVNYWMSSKIYCGTIKFWQITKEPRHLDEFAKFVIIVGADRIKIIV